jgi:hypothetical protein
MYPASCQSIQAWSKLHKPKSRGAGFVALVPPLLHRGSANSGESSFYALG